MDFEQLERLEARLLAEFHKSPSPVELRARTHAAVLRAMDIELEPLGERVKGPEGEKGAA